MGIYNFKPQFEPDIMADRKRHTIRAKRKYPDKPGSICHLFTGLRTKKVRLLKRRRCVKVQDIFIFDGLRKKNRTPNIAVDLVLLTLDEKNALAISDGFESFAAMMKFWEGRLPFIGDLIHWESDEDAARRPTSASRKHKPETDSTRQQKRKRQ